MYVSYVIDIEATGLDAKQHDIIELCIWRIGDKESKSWFLKPKNTSAIESGALRVNGHKLEDITHQTEYGRKTYLDPADVLPEIEMWIMEDGEAAENRVFIGQNPKFDYDFMLECWRKNDSEDSFPFGYWVGNGEERKNNTFLIDTIDLVKFIDLCIGKHRQRYNLTNLVKDFKITKAQAHRADGDVKMTKDLFIKIFEVLKPAIIEAFAIKENSKDEVDEVEENEDSV